MKRGAEKQLSKDDADDDDVEEVSTDQGFKIADETVLAQRKIRALPRRSMVGSPAVTPTSVSSTSEASPASGPRFGSFSGFGASSGGTSPFSFSAPSAVSASSKLAASSPSNSSFSFTPSSTSAFVSPPVSLSSAPSVTSTASRATKTFASFISPPGAAGSTPETPHNGSSDTNDDSLNTEIKYLTTLRGLNVSFLSAISKAIESDPFIDVADVLERYKSLRISAKAEYDGTAHSSSTSSRTEDRTSATVATPVSKGPTQTSAAPTTPVFSSSSMPVPPASFSWSKPSSDSTAKSSSFSDSKKDGPSVPAPSSSFAFGRPVSTSTDAPSSTAAPPSAPKSAFTFGTSAPSSVPTFGSSASTTSSTSPFGSTPSSFSFPSNPNPSSPTKAGDSKPSPFGFSAPSAFPSNIFGKPSETENAKDKGKDTDELQGNASTFADPAPGASVFGSASAFATPEKLVPANSGSFTFGSGSPGKGSVFGGFGKAGGSIGNPVGFGFGSPPRTPDGASTPKKHGNFSFATPPMPAGTEVGGDSSEGTEGEGEAPLLVTKASVHDQEGEGEEDEETTHETRSKVFKMLKDREGKSEWSDMGVGMLRLKRHKETDARRVLLRNSSTGKITINFIVHPGMNAAVTGRTVSFMGHDAGAPMPFRIRVKSEEQANALKHALDREIEFVRAKTET